MKTNWLRWGMVVALGCTLNSLAADKQAELTTEVNEAIDAFKRKDSELKKFFDSAKGYAVFPGIAKGAAGIGAAHGTGQLFEKGKITGEAKVTQVTIGFQLGGQVYSELIFFETDKPLKDFKEGHTKFSAQVSAVAAAEGVAKNAKYQDGVAIFTLAKSGLMYEASVGGQKFSFKPYK